MTPRSSSRNGSLCCLFGGVTSLLCWTVAFWRRFPPVFPFWVSSRNFRFGPPTIFCKQVACRARSETFQSLAGRHVCIFRTQSASLASTFERHCSCDTPTTELTPQGCAAFRSQTGSVEDNRDR